MMWSANCKIPFNSRGNQKENGRTHCDSEIDVEKRHRRYEMMKPVERILKKWEDEKQKLWVTSLKAVPDSFQDGKHDVKAKKEYLYKEEAKMYYLSNIFRPIRIFSKQRFNHYDESLLNKLFSL